MPQVRRSCHCLLVKLQHSARKSPKILSGLAASLSGNEPGRQLLLAINPARPPSLYFGFPKSCILLPITTSMRLEVFLSSNIASKIQKVA